MNSKVVIYNVLIFITLLVIVTNGQVCSRCRKLGETCNKNVSNICQKGSMCVDTIGNATFKCVTIPGNGGNCSLTNLCSDSYTCNPSTKICVSENYLGTGETCVNTTQCSDGLLCTNSKCTNPSYPTCSSSSDCFWNETCANDHKCKTPVANGEQCMTYSDCTQSSNCVNNKCVASLSVQVGGVCSLDSDCDISQELMCINKTCQDKDLYGLLKCNTSKDCSMGVCMCDGNEVTTTNATSNGTCYPLLDMTRVSKSVLDQYFQCVVNNKCPQVDNIIPGSCAYKCGTPFYATFNPPCNINSAISSIHINNLTLLLISMIVIFIIML
ncbi:hypothetical protein SAMD00019534_121980, partial [Acytostelium subglobosum LB1]|uniref:hypothetical protein n=1 Tax=Acytostelium subglobosum LB1 TaxID=1410327 RepID=UPI000644AC19